MTGGEMSTIQVDTATTFATTIPTTRATAAAEAQAAAAAASAEAAAAAEYELFCLVEGDQGPFSILTSSGTSIAQLKKLVLVECDTTETGDFRGARAKDLILTKLRHITIFMRTLV